MLKAWGRWWPVLTTVALILVQLPSLRRTVADPLQSDFANYLVPSRVLAAGGDLASLYEPAAFEEALGRTGLETIGSFVPHPPANALWMLPLAPLAPATAKVAWTAMLVGCLVVVIVCLRRLLPGSDPWLVAVVALGPTLAIRNGLAFGQPYLVLSALLVAGSLALERNHPLLGGLLLGAGLPFKPYAAPIGVALVLSFPARRRVLAGFILGALLPTAALVGLAGVSPLAAFREKVMPWMLRGAIQDPFSPVWGSATALVHHLFRFERDLNPNPWLDAPGLAAFLGAAIPATFVVLGIAVATRAFGEGRPREAVGAAVAFTLAASPFAASYHLVLLTLPAFALMARLQGWARAAAILFWLLLGSPAFNLIRSAAGDNSPLAFVRFGAILALALWLAAPLLARRDVLAALVAGLSMGVVSLMASPRAEAWARVEGARGYSMTRPYFCGEELRWWSPGASGRRMEPRGSGADCPRPTPAGLVTARFADGSWNLYWGEAEDAVSRRLTFSDANEFDPVLAPDGCSVIFASDQGRGLGSSALYSLDVSTINRECDRGERGASPR